MSDGLLMFMAEICIYIYISIQTYTCFCSKEVYLVWFVNQPYNFECRHLVISTAGAIACAMGNSLSAGTAKYVRGRPWGAAVLRHVPCMFRGRSVVKVVGFDSSVEI